MRRARAMRTAVAALCVAAALLSPAAASPIATPLASIAGDLGDAKCNVEEVQSANEHQLHEILGELTNMTYFRLFQVDLSRPCKFWNKPEEEDVETEEQSCSAPVPETPEFGIGAAGGFDPTAAGSEPPQMCSLDLASKDPEEMRWSPPTTPVDRTISHQEHVAMVAKDADDSEGCADEDHPEFWLDMCESFEQPAGADYVNLQLNPERWTGYNGSHVWSAIYDENCLRGVASFDDMCYEERVLYRLLSGMHVAVNAHIALKAKPPRRKVPGREQWSADPARFVAQYGAHPERLRNLHFSFVVLLRALRKAAPALTEMNLRLGQDAAEDDKTEALMRRLLDTHILSSCSSVFGAFDESMLFRAAAADMAAKDTPGTVDGGGAIAPVPSIKSQFKQVFHNISEVMDCISCQKCKLHGKLQVLGLGTALKVLLLPEHMHANALKRSEVVALVNTVAKFSHAILKVPELIAAASEDSRATVSANTDDSTNATNRSTRAVTTLDERREPRVSDDDDDWSTRRMMDAAVRATAEAANTGGVSSADERALLDAAIAADPRVLVLARYYSGTA